MSLDVLAQAHLTCRYPSQPCDPFAAAQAARLNDRETALLMRLIDSYHNPWTRILCAAFLRTVEKGTP